MLYGLRAKTQRNFLEKTSLLSEGGRMEAGENIPKRPSQESTASAVTRTRPLPSFPPPLGPQCVSTVCVIWPTACGPTLCSAAYVRENAFVIQPTLSLLADYRAVHAFIPHTFVKRVLSAQGCTRRRTATEEENQQPCPPRAYIPVRQSDHKVK